MNIWLLTSQFPPTVVGGIARYVENAATMLSRAGQRVTIVAADTVDDETTLPSGARLLRFSPRGRLLDRGAPDDKTSAHPAFPRNVLSHWPALSYEMADRVGHYLRRDGERPDVVECQEYGALPYFLLQRRLVERHPLSETPLLVSLHSPDFAITRANREPAYRLPAYWVGQMEKFCMLAADGLLASSRFLCDEIARALPQLAERPDVTPLPYEPLAQRALPPTPGDVVYFGRLQVLKGVLPLIEACAELWRRGAQFRLTLLGGDTHYAALNIPMSQYIRQRFARWFAAGNLLLPEPPLPDAALWERLASAWCVIIPSLWENFPNTCIEAMSIGKLVIASRAGGQAEMIGEEGDGGPAGILFDWNERGGCAAAIERALAMSAAEVQAVGERARQRITALTAFENVLPRRLAHYERLIAGMRQRTIFPCVTPGIVGVATPRAPEEQPGLLSVVVPLSSLGAFAEEAVASIAASSYRPLEIVLLDDGGDDPSNLDALERARARGAGLARVVRAEDGGLAQARSRGAEAARGEFLAFVGADDLVEPEFFTRAIDVLRRFENVSFVYSWVRFFGESDACWPTWNTELPYLLGHTMLTAVAVLRRSAFLAYGRSDPALDGAPEGHDAWLGMVAHGCIGVSIPDPLVRCRLRPGSMCRQVNEGQALYQAELIAERYPELYRRYGVELFALQNANGAAARWDHPAVEAVDYRAKYRDLLAHYKRVRARLRFLDPLLALARRLRP